jgi:hypothetical protein
VNFNVPVPRPPSGFPTPPACPAPQNRGGGSIRIAFGFVGHTATHNPHPMQCRGSIHGRPCSSCSSASSGNGHAVRHRSHAVPSHARHRSRVRCADPITASSIRNGSSAPVGHADMHGVSLHAAHGRYLFASRKGVPDASPAWSPSVMIAAGGHAFTHSPHRVHATRNDSSPSAPGGRHTRGVNRSANRSTAISVAVAPASPSFFNPAVSRSRLLYRWSDISRAPAVAPARFR